MSDGLDRRDFLCAAMWTTVLAAHEQLSAAPLEQPADRPQSIHITRIDLDTATPLSQMRDFYASTLGFEVVSFSNRRLVVRGGSSVLAFTFTAEGTERPPFYHFAFNIPENKILAAREWQRRRTELFLTPENLRDPSMPDDVRHFRRWNAHSIFFSDPAGNVVEYIARHTLDNATSGTFGPADILVVSEIAMAVDDPEGIGSQLEQAVGVGQYQSSSPVFRACGDEQGLLLLFERGRDLGDQLREKNQPIDVFPTTIELASRPGLGEFTLPTTPHQIVLG